MLDPLTTDQSALVLHTPATLATLSLEVLSLQVVPPGPVGLAGSGMGHLQLVKVSGFKLNLYCLFVESLFQQELVLIYHH